MCCRDALVFLHSSGLVFRLVLAQSATAGVLSWNLLAVLQLCRSGTHKKIQPAVFTCERMGSRYFGSCQMPLCLLLHLPIGQHRVKNHCCCCQECIPHFPRASHHITTTKLWCGLTMQECAISLEVIAPPKMCWEWR